MSSLQWSLSQQRGWQEDSVLLEDAIDAIFPPPSSAPPPIINLTPALSMGDQHSVAPLLLSGASRGWTEDEHQRFLVALRDYCPDTETRVAQDGRVRVGLGRGVAYFISRAIGTKTASQVRSHAQKYFEGLRRK
ncbi:hypothetical protein GUITHDRAFT_114314 [Guillardia theta CCMP2712]|uniref:Myb-like domain-containing protein n=1 Tax=Guillardia theta (strain CCMP2712) TaxID=905079 RepID=L1ITZ4_GUITC|nr:hypothetical protein GUITHDRAFT_114314 [Guillardia theta CCMP2712]EKX39587.1 hypothetical protein GUITHDRAFT_114314 [Guillardia theta CCMP2712]|eukprot:XP_005826567.1 hypothetical protein GUITHDRAFT_114314 [Guillardia theta CCMP2712]